MTREQSNVIYCVCWFSTIAVAYAFFGKVAALIVFLLPAIVISTAIVWLGEVGVDLKGRHVKRRVEPSDQATRIE